MPVSARSIGAWKDALRFISYAALWSNLGLVLLTRPDSAVSCSSVVAFFLCEVGALVPKLLCAVCFRSGSRACDTVTGRCMPIHAATSLGASRRRGGCDPRCR